MLNTNDRQQDFLWGALVGGTIAALTTLLFTTKKGQHVQQQIGQLYDQVEDNVKSAFSNAKDKVEKTVENVDKKISHARGDKEEDSSHKSSK
jgi:gas vesicle protein